MEGNAVGRLRKSMAVMVAGAMLGGSVVAAVAPAAATDGSTLAQRVHWRGGVHFGFTVPVPVVPPYYPGPYYSPPYYPGPYYPAPRRAYPHYYAPPRLMASEGCYAGPYVCPLEGSAAVGMPCSCPTAQGRVWGYAR